MAQPAPSRHVQPAVSFVGCRPVAQDTGAGLSEARPLHRARAHCWPLAVRPHCHFTPGRRSRWAGHWAPTRTRIRLPLAVPKLKLTAEPHGNRPHVECGARSSEGEGHETQPRQCTWTSLQSKASGVPASLCPTVSVLE